MRVVVGAVLVVLVWLAIGGTGGRYLGQLSELQRNDPASFLPDSAESTRVAEVIEDFRDDAMLPLIVVAERESGLTGQDLAAAKQFAAALPQRSFELGGTKTIADYLITPRVVAIPSEDGQAFIVVLQLKSDEVNETVGEERPLALIAETAREAVEEDLTGTGLTAYITGPGGFISDLSAAFAGIDGLLLAVALAVVLVILLVVYRSPLLPFAVLLTSVFGLAAAGFVVYQVTDAGYITVSGQSQGILSILVVGAATDYSLLLVSRYKEELHEYASTWEALKRAWRATLEPIAASALTVILGLLVLMLADLKGTSGLGPVAALGIIGALLAALTFLPALLVLGRRWIFWPSVPRLDHRAERGTESGRFGWWRVAQLVGARPRTTWVVTALALLAASMFLPTLKTDGIAQSDFFLTEVESVQGQEVLEKHFDAGSGSPLEVVAPQEVAEDVLAQLRKEQGVTDPFVGVAPGAPPKVVDGRVLIEATIQDTADSPAAADTVERVRADLRAIDEDVLVGGRTAQSLDTRIAADRDIVVVMPAIILVVFLVLVLLLRSVLAPALLVIANLLSFGATMGISAVVFNHILGFPGGDPTTVLYGFVFLVALGVDYSIFLMTRAREEAKTLGAR
ncbi:MAG: hypothetical protein CSB46_05385, partial [Micrococcales bacterium]